MKKLMIKGATPCTRREQVDIGRLYRDWRWRWPVLVILAMTMVLACSAAQAQARRSSGTSGTIRINGGASYACGTTVTLNLYSNGTLMRFCNSGDTWTSWQAFSTTTSWTLTSGEGLQTVSAQFKTATGKAITVSASITLDLTAPATTDNSDGQTHQTFTVVLTPSDTLSGVASTQYRIDGGPWQSGVSVTLVRTTRETRHSHLCLSRGNHLVEYYSTDNTGNVEVVKSCTVTL